MVKHLNYANTHFILSAPDIKHLPADSGIEIAFVGRSNAGKSSALNRLVRQKKLARTSKVPGRTQYINLFEIERDCRIVDLPGYGYAKVPEAIKRKWQNSLGEYLQKRESLAGLVLLTDIRHPLNSLDQQMLRWSMTVDLPLLLLLTKADKLSRGAQTSQLYKVRQSVSSFQLDITVGIFSSLKGTGLPLLETKLNEWFHPVTAVNTPSLT